LDECRIVNIVHFGVYFNFIKVPNTLCQIFLETQAYNKHASKILDPENKSSTLGALSNLNLLQSLKDQSPLRGTLGISGRIFV